MTKKSKFSFNRRKALGVFAVGTALSSAAMRGSALAQSGGTTYVLVHGAWHGGWCWRRVADRLTAKGHKVYTPALTGLADRKHLLSDRVDLNTHVDDVVNLIQWEDLNNIVLVGRSYAGLVISSVSEKVARGTTGSIVFLDAFYPQDGQSGEDITGPMRNNPAWKKILEESSGLIVPPIPAAAFKVNEADRAMVDAKCTPHPARTFESKVSPTGARERIAKKAYIRATVSDSPNFRKAYDLLKADSSWKTYEVAAGHDVMLDAPDRLTEILLEVA